MKKAIFLLLAAFVAAGLSAQDKIINDPNAQQRTVTSFHGIKISDGISLILKQGNEEGVVVSASETKYRDRIKTEVVDGRFKNILRCEPLERHAKSRQKTKSLCISKNS